MPLLKRARELWMDLNEKTGREIFHATGGVYLNPPTNIQKEKQVAQIHNLDVELLSTDQLRQRFPIFTVPDGWTALYEPAAGFIVPEWSIPAYVNIAQ